MTTFSTIFGTLPIALGLGAGGESRAPMGIAVIGGMFFSTLLTLVVAPVVYILLDELVSRVRGRTAETAHPHELAAALSSAQGGRPDGN